MSAVLNWPLALLVGGGFSLLILLAFGFVWFDRPSSHDEQQ